jgi:2-C-methyl-D-erythritol 2,4-cyclodiphosphate synthase
MFKVGIGYDSHRLVEGRSLIIGAVEVPFEKGLAGHSDGDVLIHAIIDSLLGAAGKEDIGVHFPDTDQTWKDASSIEMLRYVLRMLKAEGWDVINVDSTLIAERPKLRPFIPQMIERLQGVGLKRVNIKAKTNEEMGFIGRGEGIAAIAVSLISKQPEI